MLLILFAAFIVLGIAAALMTSGKTF